MDDLMRPPPDVSTSRDGRGEGEELWETTAYTACCHKPVAVEFLSDQSVNFQHLNNPVVNYEDPNLNISIPIFSINGNHDDCSGEAGAAVAERFSLLVSHLGKLGSIPGRVTRFLHVGIVPDDATVFVYAVAVGVSAMDVIGTTGLLNYFAKWNDFKKVDISPLLMQKGASRLAIYGLSYMNDERLSRLFRDGKVQMLQPSVHAKEWFNLMVLHQNRVDHGKYTFIPEEALADFLDLVMWGHEHECRIVPEKNPLKKFHVTQPGSSVATSLSAGESVEKYVGILKVYKKDFKLEPVKLETVRPFVMDTITLSKCNIEHTVENPSKKTGHGAADLNNSVLDHDNLTCEQPYHPEPSPCYGVQKSLPH
ncbi:hypothetical protein PR048_027639 [Dryococelus australis]|uniref:Uncharacterized protein n=1 Tax=Dryococelus australis TaxID=614101 RepID=A0ABQ9GH24_9NEOP|nr:hypothetical protein PR048_027639 [Dryococelus australis]